MTGIYSKGSALDARARTEELLGGWRRLGDGLEAALANLSPAETDCRFKIKFAGLCWMGSGGGTALPADCIGRPLKLRPLSRTLGDEATPITNQLRTAVCLQAKREHHPAVPVQGLGFRV
jgi:hypothetical protein